YILQDTQTSILLTNQTELAGIKNYSGEIIRFGSDIKFLDHSNLTDPSRSNPAPEMAYLIYTSGSTGRPKGVIGQHKAAINRLNWMQQTYPYKAGEICCQKTSLSFVDSIAEMFSPLLSGIPQVIIPDNDLKDTRIFVELLGRYQISRLVLVPSLLRSILEVTRNSGIQLPDLRIWVSSGEALTPDIVSSFFNQFQDRKLLNFYGSSEVSADSTFYEISSADRKIGIGRPIFNTQVYILDDSLQPVPAGVTG
ncbi:MAG: AMP-binding protein, partial [Chloroflexota bacterium]